MIVFCLPLIILSATQGSYGFNSNPMDFRSFLNCLYQSKLDTTKGLFLMWGG